MSVARPTPTRLGPDRPVRLPLVGLPGDVLCRPRAALAAIEVFADVVCPFTHVGLTRTVQSRFEQGRTDVVLRVRSWPLELVNGASMTADHVARRVEALRDQVAPELFAGFDPRHVPASSIPALSLAAAAYRQGDDTGERLSLALRRALFEEGRDLSDPDVLQQLADDHGVLLMAEDEATVRLDWHEGRRRGVKGSPHFFCGSIEAFCPALDIRTDASGAVTIRANPSRLDLFLAQCFAGTNFAATNRSADVGGTAANG
jgi:predicted DsbA family dithiol-disulfide isomerase